MYWDGISSKFDEVGNLLTELGCAVLFKAMLDLMKNWIFNSFLNAKASLTTVDMLNIMILNQMNLRQSVRKICTLWNMAILCHL